MTNTAPPAKPTLLLDMDGPLADPSSSKPHTTLAPHGKDSKDGRGATQPKH